jgi:hypothetical protein
MKLSPDARERAARIARALVVAAASGCGALVGWQAAGGVGAGAGAGLAGWMAAIVVYGGAGGDDDGTAW